VSTAKAIMTPNPLMLGSGTDILDAVEFFNRHGISSAPVQNPLGEILGQLTEINLVKALVHYRASSDYCKVIHAEQLFEPAFFVDDTDDVATVLKAIVRTPSHRVLVKDRRGNGKIVGIISPKDLLRTIQGGGEVSRIVVDEVQALQKELEEMRGQLHEMNHYLQTYDTVFQSGLFGLHSADRFGKIVFANERLHEALGYPMGELVGKTIYDLYPAAIHDEAREGLRRVMAEGQHALTVSSMVTKNGKILKVDVASAALKDEMGRFIGTFTISRFHGSEAMKAPINSLFP
jgi:PAS domain S-box-containing protein